MLSRVTRKFWKYDQLVVWLALKCWCLKCQIWKSMILGYFYFEFLAANWLKGVKTLSRMGFLFWKILIVVWIMAVWVIFEIGGWWIKCPFMAGRFNDREPVSLVICRGHITVAKGISLFWNFWTLSKLLPLELIFDTLGWLINCLFMARRVNDWDTAHIDDL